MTCRFPPAVCKRKQDVFCKSLVVNKKVFNKTVNFTVKLSAQELRAWHSREIYSELKHKTYCVLEHAVLHFPAVKLYCSSGDSM